ncbi:tyrosine-type recombinase/integrase [Streptomyces sp. NPDC059862]|uniref:tyrosine-type recombinase/integrase n=1 Tax=Streptomyces sp. NPDC059862 TaxID=3346975 RepID=UPI003655FBBF
MSEPSRELLPVVDVGTVTSRTTSDRLEVLTALIAAPNFEALLRDDVIVMPPDHATFAWQCGVPDCERAVQETREFCTVHYREWTRRCKEHGTQATLAEFLGDAQPLKPRMWARTPPQCLICVDVPAWGNSPLCFLHKNRWRTYRRETRQQNGVEQDLHEWVAKQPRLPHFGQCQVVACPEVAVHLLGLCRRHFLVYRKDGQPGGASVPNNWGRMLTEWKKSTPAISYADEAEFRRWCRRTSSFYRSDGKLTLLGLRPLVRAEIKWAMFHHTQVPDEQQGTLWALPEIQRLAEECRRQEVNSLADLDLEPRGLRPLRHQSIAKAMLRYLRLVYFTREDTKDVGYIETEQFGVRFPHRASHWDLTGVSQRWLRDLLWEAMADRLLTKPPRSGTILDQNRRAFVELSAFLEARAPGGGHDPRVLDKTLAIDFATDQRHRAAHRLPTLGLQRRGRSDRRTGKPSTHGPNMLAHVLGGCRRILRDALHAGVTDQIGLDRAFIVAIPSFRPPVRRRSPFPDDLARALADEKNLQRMEDFDPTDRGLRDAWETLVLTGRRANEVLQVRYACIARLAGLPLFWHDQTKVGNYDQAIRIPERLFARIEQRQAKTRALFIQRYGRPPTAAECKAIALFPSRIRNRNLLRGVSHGGFLDSFREWLATLDLGHGVPHQARHTLATNLLKNGADLVHVKRYLGQISKEMAEHYVHLAHDDPKLNDALTALWVTGPGAAEPGVLLSDGAPMSREEAEALSLDLTRRSTPAEGGFCTFQPVVDGGSCPWMLNCHNCDKFVMSGADLVYWHRKREQWRMLAEGAPDSATADYLHQVFEPTARAIDGLEKALASLGLLEDALVLDLRRPQDYFGRVWSTAFRAQELAWHEGEDSIDTPAADDAAHGNLEEDW